MIIYDIKTYVVYVLTYLLTYFLQNFRNICQINVTFICYSLRQIDIEFMRRLHDKVNIIPVIAKADTLTQQEVKRLKARVMEQIRLNKIEIYQFPECDEDEDEEFKKQNEELKARV